MYICDARYPNRDNNEVIRKMIQGKKKKTQLGCLTGVVGHARRTAHRQEEKDHQLHGELLLVQRSAPAALFLSAFQLERTTTRAARCYRGFHQNYSLLMGREKPSVAPSQREGTRCEDACGGVHTL